MLPQAKSCCFLFFFFLVKPHPAEGLLNTVFFVLPPSRSQPRKLFCNQWMCPKRVKIFFLCHKNKSCLQNQGGAINTRDVKCDQIVGKKRCSLLNEWRRIIIIAFISLKTKPRVCYLVQGISLSITVNFAGKALQKFSAGSASQQRPRPTPSSPLVRGSAVISPAVMIPDKSSQRSRELFAHSTLGLGMHNSVCGSSPPAAGNDQPSWLDSCHAGTVAWRAEQSWPDAGSVPSIQSW